MNSIAMKTLFLTATLLYPAFSLPTECALVMGLTRNQRCAGYEASIRDRYEVQVLTREHKGRETAVVLVGEATQAEDSTVDHFGIIEAVLNAYEVRMVEGLSAEDYFFKHFHLKPQQMDSLNGLVAEEYTKFGSLLRAAVTQAREVAPIEQRLVNIGIKQFTEGKPLPEIMQSIKQAVDKARLEAALGGDRTADLLSLHRIEDKISRTVRSDLPPFLANQVSELLQMELEEGHRPGKIENIRVSAFAASRKGKLSKTIAYSAFPSVTWILNNLNWISKEWNKRGMLVSLFLTGTVIIIDGLSDYWGPIVIVKTSHRRNKTAVKNINDYFDSDDKPPALLNIFRNPKVKGSSRVERLKDMLLRQGYTARDDLLGC